MTLSTATASWFSHTDTSAPQLNNAAGSLISVLRACLVTGYNVKSVSQIEVAAGVATVTCTGHAYTSGVGKLVLISGATEALLNGRKQPTSTGPNTFTYAAPGVANGTYTGTMEARRAPLGWTEEFAGTVPNVAVFRQSEVTTDRVYLRVSDVLGTTARIIAYETMSDADNGVGATPTNTQLSGGVHWPKSDGATVRQWDLVGSAQGFYWMPAALNLNAREAFFAGRIVPRNSAQVFGFALCGNASGFLNYSGPSDALGGVWASGRETTRRSAPVYVMRNYSGFPGALEARPVGAAHNAFYVGQLVACSGSFNYGCAAYPNPANNGMRVCVVDLYSPSFVDLGHYPGMLHIVGDIGALVSHGVVFDGTDQFQGKKLLGLSAGALGVSTQGQFRGMVLFDMTGPWV